MSVIRVNRHPHDSNVVVVSTPPAMNEHVRRFEPLGYAPDLKAYVMHHDHMPALYRFAKSVGMYVVDERNANAAPQVTPPAECRHCQQPGSRGNPPRMCPRCGSMWDPVPPPPTAIVAARTACTACGHKQTGRFAYCSQCGEEMTYARALKPAPVIARPKLADPQSAGDMIRQYAPRIPAPVQPQLPPVHEGRPVRDVDLPAGDEEPTPW